LRNEFEHGLDVILDAVERYRDAACRLEPDA
jgi:hypothetical protein